MKKNNKTNTGNLILKIILWTILFIILSIGGFFVYCLHDLPRPEEFQEAQFAQSAKIYDRTGQVVLSSFSGEEKRTYVKLEEFPQILIDAVIATEDAKFFSHPGVDFHSLLRAILVDLKLKSPAQGGSTITQQLIRSTFLTNEKTLERKLKEIVLALELDAKYSKEQILEWYLNQIPFGANIYGAQEASLIYFSKPVSGIDLNEAATLAAMIQAPSYYYPYSENYAEHKDDLMARKNYVLSRMAQENFITAQEADSLKEKEPEFSPLPKTLAPHFVQYVKQELIQKYGETFLETKGLKVYTTLDWDIQKTAQEAVKNGVENAKKRFSAYNGALVAINPNNGEILAMVGSADPDAPPYPQGCLDKYPDCLRSNNCCKFVPYFNVAVQGERQPGSSFKPIVYAKAFQNGYNDKTIVVDELTNFGIYGGKAYIPYNFDLKFRGPVTLREALAQSLNVPSVKVLRDLAGLNESIELAREVGITTLDEDPSFYGLSIVLGGGGVKLLDMVSAYGVFANGGSRIVPSSIIKIEDNNGKIIYQRNFTPKKVLEKSVCDLITDILSDNEARAPIFGVNSVLTFDSPKVAVKTGTSQDYVDGWTIGYTKDIVVGVWVGNNDNSPMARGLGVSSAGPIWREVIKFAISR